MKHTDEKVQKELREFFSLDKEAQRASLFDSFIWLLTDAVAKDDPEMIKSCARLVTEMWNESNEGEDDES